MSKASARRKRRRYLRSLLKKQRDKKKRIRRTQYEMIRARSHNWVFGVTEPVPMTCQECSKQFPAYNSDDISCPECVKRSKRENPILREHKVREFWGLDRVGCIDRPTDRRYSAEMEPW